MKNKTTNFSAGEEDCDGLCPDIRVRGDLGNYQFRWIFMTKTIMKLTIMMILMKNMMTLMFLMKTMMICFLKLYAHVRFTMGGRSIAQVAVS